MDTKYKVIYQKLPTNLMTKIRKAYLMSHEQLSIQQTFQPFVFP